LCDEDPDLAIRETLGHRQLVEIAAVVVVDRGPEEGPQVAQPIGFCAGGSRDRPELLEGGRREIRRETFFPHGAAGDLVEVGTVAARPVVHGAIFPRTETPAASAA
jgi:hypothetical protein